MSILNILIPSTEKIFSDNCFTLQLFGEQNVARGRYRGFAVQTARACQSSDKTTQPDRLTTGNRNLLFNNTEPRDR